LTEKQFEDFTVDIADHRLAKYDRYAELVRARIDDPEVRFVSFFLRRNTRTINKRYYKVTYTQLKTLLNKFDYDLVDPKGNYIDVVRLEDRRRMFGFGTKEQTRVKVCQIGFPNWTAQVGKGAIKTVRSACRLTYESGVDSQTFFKGADPIGCLIARYQEPLRNLAHR
jgi:hypothetical protein